MLSLPFSVLLSYHERATDFQNIHAKFSTQDPKTLLGFPLLALRSGNTTGSEPSNRRTFFLPDHCPMVLLSMVYSPGFLCVQCKDDKREHSALFRSNVLVNSN